MTEDIAGLNQYWSQPLDSLLTALHSTPDGLSTAEARQRLERFGPNLLEAREKATALGLFLNQFKSPIILILLFATGVSAVLKDWVDALVILAV
jgi:Mg2+-importing ATPase